MKWWSAQYFRAAGTAGCLALSLAAHGDTPAGRRARLTEIREMSLQGRQRIVITLDRNTEIQQACLTRPARLYFDFRHTKIARPLRMNRNAAKLHKMRRIRLGRHTADTVRAVLEVRGIAHYVTYKTGTPARLIIELSPGRAHDSPCRIASHEKPVALLNAPVIVIDPGHGGSDKGIIGAGGSNEAEIALAVGKRLAALLQNSGDVQVVLTRSDDRYLSLKQRVGIARSAKADLFVSLHAQAGPTSAECGPRAYYLALTTSRAALRMASRENADYNHTVFELPALIVAIMRDRHVQESRQLEGTLADAFSAHRAARDEQPQEPETARAPLALLMGLDSPGVFVSLGCLKDPEEALQSSVQERKLAHELYAGISDFLREKMRKEMPQPAR